MNKADAADKEMIELVSLTIPSNISNIFVF
jgi:hypothetical protein